MISLTLLRLLLRTEPDHPLYAHTYFYGRRIRIAKTRRPIIRVLRRTGIMLLLLVVVPVMLILSIPASMLSFVGILSGATIAGSHAATRVALNIYHEQYDKRFDILSVGPAGMMGLCWVLALRYFQKSDTARQLRRLFRWVYGLIFGGVLFLAIIVPFFSGLALDVAVGIADATNPNDAITAQVYTLFFSRLIGVVIFVVFLWVDFLQSIVMGVLVGIGATRLPRSNIDAGITAFGGFLTMQIGLYVIMIVFALILPASLVNTSSIVVIILLMLVQITIALMMREAVIVGLWNMVAESLNADLQDLQALAPVQR